MRRAMVSGVAALVLMAPVAGCTSSDGSSDSAREAAASGTQSPSGAASDAETSAAPSASSAPAAADGTNVEACRDGSCQILVTGPLTVPLDGAYLGDISLSLENDLLAYEAAPAPGSSLGGSIGVGCAVLIRVHGTGGRSSSGCGPNATFPADVKGVVLRASQGSGGVIADIGTMR
ncbi:hypothetical protein [Yinghuangia sp. YIM S10712]|uniref:hypothetical protein n=1 Tax=Yinghuangia sp. YIM S10712 TaxID=3436930 RepID=UPI003F53A0CE